MIMQIMFSDIFPDRAAARRECHHTRHAESPVVVVGVCSCGMMQLHTGALTARLAPRALAKGHGTIGQVVFEHAAHSTAPLAFTSDCPGEG